MSEIIQQTKEELLQSYKDALAKHDWYYQYSDDPFVYRKGCKTFADIAEYRRKCISAGLKEEADEVYQQFWNLKLSLKRY